MASRRGLLICVSLLAALSQAKPARRVLDPVCLQIAGAISSNSDVYYPGELKYIKDVSHWASSSSQVAKCSVEPGTAEDLAKILKIVGETKTPFAVKGGGHASNPGFSSTTGIQIAMYRFSEVTYDASSSTAVIGSGLIWDDVYSALEPHGVNVIGGRVTGVGVAGFTLGGGYSWKTNQYGLTVDTVTAFELVKPSGVIATVTASSDPELFFALKGGGNNFGVVTRFTLKTFPQTEVWGGLLTYTLGQIDEVNAAASKFASEVTDKKAAIITTYNFLLGQPGVSQLLFYDAPTPPAGIFDDFLNIPHFSKDIDTRSFLSLVKTAPANATANSRGVFHTVPVTGYTPELLDAIVNETTYWGSKLSLATGSFISFDVEPFLPSAYLVGTSESAYPPTRSMTVQPLNIYWAWQASSFDAAFHDGIRKSAAHLEQVALSLGQSGVDTAALYPNYAIFGTPLERIYGQNVNRLKGIKQQVDPNNVMGLSGGFKL